MSRPTADEVRSTPMTAPPGIPAGEERSRRSKRPTSEEMHGQAAPPFEPAVPGGKPEPESPAVAKSRRQLEEAQTAERQENAEKAKLERIASYSKRLEVAKIHSDEIKLIVPPGHPLAAKKEILASDLIGEPLLLPKVGTTRSRLTAWLEPVLDGTWFLSGDVYAVSRLTPPPKPRSWGSSVRLRPRKVSK